MKKENKWITSFEAISDLDSPTDNGETKYKRQPNNLYQALIRRNAKKHNFAYNSLF